ncbi:MAG: diacylglycerol kinase [Glaciihabitans sp.]|nr:diacylglycerol kinase [Glaciihabitans sp.]
MTVDVGSPATEPESEKPRAPIGQAAVVYNPIKVDIDAIKAAVSREEKAAGWPETLYFETSAEDPGQGPTKQALDAGATLVIVAGGDGTVRAVAEAIRNSDATLALLPSGTGNLLARNLKLTLNDLDHSINSAFTGRDRDIDIAQIKIRRADDSVDEHSYLVMAGLGIDAKMIANTDDDLKKKAGWLAYVQAILMVFRDKETLRFRYQLDDHSQHNVRVHSIMIGNCGSLPANILLMPDAAVDDGVFDVLLLKPKGVWGWLQIFGKVFWENGVLSRTKAGRSLPTKEVDALTYTTGKKLSLRLSRPEEIELDGDGFGKATAFRTWLEPGGLTVRVPADS